MKDYADIDSKFRFVILASKRAKELLRGAKPKIKSKSKNLIRIAQEEVQQGLIEFELIETPVEEVSEGAKDLILGEELGMGPDIADVDEKSVDTNVDAKAEEKEAKKAEKKVAKKVAAIAVKQAEKAEIAKKAELTKKKEKAEMKEKAEKAEKKEKVEKKEKKKDPKEDIEEVKEAEKKKTKKATKPKSKKSEE